MVFNDIGGCKGRLRETWYAPGDEGLQVLDNQLAHRVHQVLQLLSHWGTQLAHKNVLLWVNNVAVAKLFNKRSGPMGCVQLLKELEKVVERFGFTLRTAVSSTMLEWISDFVHEGGALGDPPPVILT